MTREEALNYIPLLSAYGAGKAIQAELESGWSNVGSRGLSFNLPPERYRIKPEPREFYVVLGKNGGTVDSSTEKCVLQRRYASSQIIHCREVVE